MQRVRVVCVLVGLTVMIGLLASRTALAAWNKSPSNEGSVALPGTSHASSHASPLGSVVNGTKRFFGGLKHTFTPKHGASKDKSSSLFRQKTPKPKKPAEPFWSGWFRPKEPPPPKSMRDWMALEPIRP